MFGKEDHLVVHLKQSVRKGAILNKCILVFYYKYKFHLSFLFISVFICVLRLFILFQLINIHLQKGHVFGLFVGATVNEIK